MKGNPMKKTRILASATSAVVLVTGATAFAVLGGGGSASAAGIPSSAYGIDLSLAGNAIVETTPSVVSSDGKLVTDSLADIPLDPIAEAGVVTVSAENGAATAAVADLDVVLVNGALAPLATLGTQLKPLCDGLDQIPISTILSQITGPDGSLLPAVLGPLVQATTGTPLDLSLITAIDLSKVLPAQLGDLCDFALSGNLLGATAVEASCNGQTGTTTLTLTDGLLASLIDTNKPNSSLAIDGVVEVTVNRQTKNADGTFTVDALYVNLLDQVELTVASATCGNVTSDGGPTTGPTESDAPTPTPVESHVPVTG